MVATTHPMAALWIGLTLLVACGTPPTLARIIADLDGDGSYSTTDVALPTLRDWGALEGDAVLFHTGATLDLDAVVNEDDGRSRDRAIRNPGTPHMRYLRDGEVAVADSFLGLSMVSGYAHFEAAVMFFAGLGVVLTGEPAPVYFHPQIEGPADLFPRTDNAVYLPATDAFFLMPMEFLQAMPFATNRGVIVHEVTHRVWYKIAWDGRMLALRQAIDTHAATVAWVLLRATEEGVADFFGAVAADNPRFLVPSAGTDLGDPRDLQPVRSVEAGWLTGNMVSPYDLGAVVASTLWGFAAISGRDATCRALLAAGVAQAAGLGDLPSYSVGELEAATIAGLPPADRAALCARAAASYAASWLPFQGLCP